MDIAETESKEVAVVLLDAEKAFDRVSWKYLWSTLVERGFGLKCLRALQAMYYKPYRQIQMMGNTSKRIEISLGTRQGCPCSPILFAFYLDPFIARILNNHAIKPVVIQGFETKVLAYADDIGIVTSDLRGAIEFEKMAEEFGRSSGYLLNKGKTQIICSAQCRVQDSRVTKVARYLGVKDIKITPSMMVLGYDDRAMLDTVQRDLVFISMMVARLIITTFWKDKEPPTYQYWVHRILNLSQQEISLYKCKGVNTRQQRLKRWGPLLAWMEKNGKCWLTGGIV